MNTLSAFARRIVESDDLAEKLAPPPRDLTDEGRDTGPPPDAPGRPPELRIVTAKEARVPPLSGWGDLAQRRRILHALANHELQATELFARALVAYPEAPSELRQEILVTLRDEQVHTRLYLHRLRELGASFGDYPVSGLFWHRIVETTTIEQFLCALSLTFENANLDHAPEIAAAAREHGDEESARILDRVAADEERHVALGARWIGASAQPGEGLWEAYQRHLYWPLHPGRARGTVFQRDSRIRAGLDQQFVENLARAADEVPMGSRRHRPREESGK